MNKRKLERINRFIEECAAKLPEGESVMVFAGGPGSNPQTNSGCINHGCGNSINAGCTNTNCLNTTSNDKCTNLQSGLFNDGCSNPNPPTTNTKDCLM